MKNLYLFGCLLLLASCDVWDSANCNIRNATSRTVTFRFYHEYLEDENEYNRKTLPDSVVVVAPYSFVTLYSSRGFIKHDEPHLNNPMDYIDSVNIQVDTGVLIKDIMNPGNWEGVKAGKNRNGLKEADHYEYTFVIKPEDIR